MIRALSIPPRHQRIAAAEVKQCPQSGARLVAICIAAILVILVDATAVNVVSSGLPILG
jgi:hypothetical protein